MSPILPQSLFDQIAETLRSLDWHTILFIAGVVLSSYAGFLTLSGLEGWILACSLGPWVRGFIMGAAAAGSAVGVLLFRVMHMAPDSNTARISLAVTAVFGGLLAGYITVAAFWKTRRLRIFLLGGLFCVIAYLVVVLVPAARGGAGIKELAAMVAAEVCWRDDAGRLAADWPGIAKLAVIFAAGGGLYTVAHRLLYPLVWLLRNGALLAVGVILLSAPQIRETLAGSIRQAAGTDVIYRAVTDNAGFLIALAGAAYLAAAYAMWIQNFARNFRNFSSEVLEAEYGSLGLFTMIGCSVGTAFSTLGRMLTLRRSAAGRCRILKTEEKQEDEEKMKKDKEEKEDE